MKPEGISHATLVPFREQYVLHLLRNIIAQDFHICRRCGDVVPFAEAPDAEFPGLGFSMGFLHIQLSVLAFAATYVVD